MADNTNTQIWVEKKDRDRLKKLHKKFQPNYTPKGFFKHVLDMYEIAHCPECGSELVSRECSCKAPERL